MVDAYLVGQGLAIVVASAVALFDRRTGEIPDWITLPAIALAVIGYAAAGGLLAGGLAFGGAALCALLPFLLHRAAAMGGGDVKAFAAIGALLGPGPGLEAQVVALCLAIVVEAVALFRAGELRSASRRAAGLVFRRPDSAEDAGFRRVRLGVSILAGTVLAVAAIRL